MEITAGVVEEERVAELKRCLIDTVYGTDLGSGLHQRYTAFSELWPLLAVGTIPLLKVEKISQAINTTSLTIENSTILSSPVATSSFSATAAFEVRSPSRIQVEFKEGTFKPPEIKSKINLPENMDIFGQNISLSPVQQSLGPLENAVARYSPNYFWYASSQGSNSR
ncbi:hypothetical protein K7X08_030028 [Anisodus acutangulus]|uniref:Plastid lipid-associated protein/fibrillin conserved domain-containing protein n=1 Tax=Anisodus acutangulus TaxID=402998 RepID=A0A9Q1LJZ1_9SOLA|nr:hypothetical protein K7X08_030028 [Anisodus acutangulus]